MTKSSTRQLLSIKSTASLLDVSVETVWKLIKTKKLPVIKINNKVLLSQDHIRRFIKKYTIPATNTSPQEVIIVLK